MIEKHVADILRHTKDTNISIAKVGVEVVQKHGQSETIRICINVHITHAMKTIVVIDHVKN